MKYSGTEMREEGSHPHGNSTVDSPCMAHAGRPRGRLASDEGAR
jgi:hypothetical protein